MYVVCVRGVYVVCVRGVCTWCVRGVCTWCVRGVCVRGVCAWCVCVRVCVCVHRGDSESWWLATPPAIHQPSNVFSRYELKSTMLSSTQENVCEITTLAECCTYDEINLDMSVSGSYHHWTLVSEGHSRTEKDRATYLEVADRLHERQSPIVASPRCV